MKKMTRLPVIAGAITLAFLCVSAEPTSKPLFRTQSDRIDELEKQNLELKKKMVELNSKLEILTRRVNDCNGGGGSTNFGEENVSRGPGASVPGELQVVRIRPDAPATPPRRKGIVTRASAEDSIIAPLDTPPIVGTLPGTNYSPPPDPANPSALPPVVSYPPASVPAVPAAPATPSAPLAAGEAAAYKQIKDMWDSDRTDLSVPLMAEYLRRHAKGAHEDEVAYRLGLYYYSQSDYRKAVEPLRKIRQAHFTSSIAPDAIYTLGLCYAELGMMKEAQEALEEVVSIYPFSDAAPKATKKLESIH